MRRLSVILVACLVMACGTTQLDRMSVRRAPVENVSHQSSSTALVRLREEMGIVQRRFPVVLPGHPQAWGFVSAFVNARPVRLPIELVRRLLAAQEELDHLLSLYRGNGGRVWCERTVVHSGGAVTVDVLPFAGLPRYADVMRETTCYIDDPTYPVADRRPVTPFLVLAYRLNPENDITGEEYTMERYPLAPIEPIPNPTPLPIVCYGDQHLFCHVVEGR